MEGDALNLRSNLMFFSGKFCILLHHYLIPLTLYYCGLIHNYGRNKDLQERKYFSFKFHKFCRYFSLSFQI